MKNQLVYIILMSVCVFVSCKTTPKATEDSVVKTDDHSSRNSLDWDGIYRGIVPCADCDGIETTVYLNKDLSYILKTRYLGKEDSAREYKGSFTWNDAGNTVTLNNPSNNELNQSYFVGENTLTQLDKSGNKITGDLANDYILSKANYAIVEKYWKLTELYGKPVTVDSTIRKEPHLVIKDSANGFYGNGGCNMFNGTYEIKGMNRIKFSHAISTRMACRDMETENLFFKVLGEADNFNVNGDMLVLNKARMAPLARFKTVNMVK